MIKRTFIILQLWKSSCIRVQQGRCYFLVLTFKIKNDRIGFISWILRYSEVVENLIRLQLRKTLCRNFGNFDSRNAPFKQKKPNSIISTRFQVLGYRSFSDKRTHICFCFLIQNIYTCPYSSRIFLKFYLLMTKVSIPFSHFGNRYRTH